MTTKAAQNISTGDQILIFCDGCAEFAEVTGVNFLIQRNNPDNPARVSIEVNSTDPQQALRVYDWNRHIRTI